MTTATTTTQINGAIFGRNLAKEDVKFSSLGFSRKRDSAAVNLSASIR